MSKQKGNIRSRTASEIGAEIIESMDHEFHNASDRVLAIVGAAYLDSLLEQLLRAVLVDDEKEANILLEPDRPLSSYGSRYQLAYCLGLIERNQRDDLKMIARIRNAFAHRYSVRSFEHDEVRKLLSKLHYGKELDSILEELVRNTSDSEKVKHLQDVASSGRRKFQDTVLNLFTNLMHRLNAVVRPDKSTWYRGVVL